MRILHFADTHIDEKNFDEKKKCMIKIVNTAYGQRPDLIIFAGDAFNSREIKAESRSARLFFLTINSLSEAAPVVVLTGTPSHDGSAPMLLRYFHDEKRVIVSDYPEQLFLSGGKCYRDVSHMDENYIDAIISMVPAPTKQFFNIDDRSIEESNMDIGQAMTTLFRGFASTAQNYKAPHILVGHFNVAGSEISPTQILIGKDIEVSRHQLKESCADLICLGLIHKAQQIGENIFYSGGTQANTWGELDPKGFYIHDLKESPGGWKIAASEFIPTPSKKRIWLRHDLTTSPLDSIYHTYTPEQIKDSIVRIDIKVFKDEQGIISKHDLVDYFESRGADIVDVNITCIARETIRSDRVAQAVTLHDKIKAMAETRGEEFPMDIQEKIYQLEIEDHMNLVNKWTHIFSRIVNDADLEIEYPPNTKKQEKQ